MDKRYEYSINGEIISVKKGMDSYNLNLSKMKIFTKTEFVNLHGYFFTRTIYALNINHNIFLFWAIQCSCQLNIKGRFYEKHSNNPILMHIIYSESGDTYFRVPFIQKLTSNAMNSFDIKHKKKILTSTNLTDPFFSANP